jgi:hypothetical protein
LPGGGVLIDPDEKVLDSVVVHDAVGVGHVEVQHSRY